MSRGTRLAKKKKSSVVHIYLKPEKEHVYYKIVKILEREGRSFSDLVWERIESYVRLHEPGNPQQTLPEIVRRKKAYVAPKRCGITNCERECVAVYVHESGYEMPVCDYHNRLISKEPKWRMKEA